MRVKSRRIGKNELVVASRSFNNLSSPKQAPGKSARIVFIMGACQGGGSEKSLTIEVCQVWSEYDERTRTYAREKYGGLFDQDGDSGSPVGLEDGQAGGIYVDGVTAKLDESGEVFEFSMVANLSRTFAHIKATTGCELEIPKEVDLTTSGKRDQYHYEETGRLRQREYS